MNDLADLKDVWGEPAPPTQSARTAARAALMRQITAVHNSAPAPERPRRLGVRLGWLTGGVAVAAGVAAVVAFAVPTGTERSTEQTNSSSGQQILLSAAVVADAQPAGTGKYWHLSEVVPDSNGHPQKLDTWVGHDGSGYSEPEGTNGVYPTTVGGGFSVGAASLTLDQVNALPTDPAALTAWITDTYTHPAQQPAPVVSGRALPFVQKQAPPADAIPSYVATNLPELLGEVPAPPAVRAAALRALAAMPNVTSLGAMDGGQGLRIAIPSPPADKYPGGKVPAGADHLTLVIDPTTSMLISTTSYGGTIKITKAGWTNDLPRIIDSSK
ncbi:CU044_5270 family protein [Rugosimonospora acidiphila]|uniref:CU044_5270 family protein n=1 Tax=Rugosimonospora acidiphila TaxID=556531 RepID=A0ABP9SIS2_9ACTN